MPPEECYDSYDINNPMPEKCRKPWQDFWNACMREDKFLDPVCMDPHHVFLKLNAASQITLSEEAVINPTA